MFGIAYINMTDVWYMCLLFRYQLPIIFIVINNNGIGFGMDKDSFDSARTDNDPRLRLTYACSANQLLDAIYLPIRCKLLIIMFLFLRVLTSHGCF